MGQVVQLDATTLLIKSDNKSDLAEIIDFVSMKHKQEQIRSFLEFASQNKVLCRSYRFNREDCHDRQGIHR